MRAAASSIARGSPSRRTQISAMVRALASVSWKLGLMARPRCTKRVQAAYCARTSLVGRCFRSGRGSGETANSRSPCSRSGARLVTSRCRFGQAANRSASLGAAASTCSKLSSSSRRECSPSARCTSSSTVRAAVSRRPSAWAMAGSTRSGSLMAARGTKQTLPAKSGRKSRATASKRRVLPTPPGPVRVSRRTSGRRSKAVSWVSSCSRPSRGVSGSGRE
jgi:hypothetical protein